nr:stAR-related lipid transfer protein 7, mitochondrial-like isoform X1 [Ipomoea batatas]
MFAFVVPVCIAFLLGVFVGWNWKPKWARRSLCLWNSNFDFSAPFKPRSLSSVVDYSVSEKDQIVLPPDDTPESSSSLQDKNKEIGIVTDVDLEHLYHLTGPPQYCSRTVYEDATPELLRDFFWDDEFRFKWDDMIVHASTIEECPITGTMVVHWGVPWPSIPRRDKPRRVDLYYSSWYIRAVEPQRSDGEMSSACEVILFHHEDMGIPWEVAKFGVRHGMWGTVKNIERGFRAYQKYRATGGAISRCAFMAQINTKLDPAYLNSSPEGIQSDSTESQLIGTVDDKPGDRAKGFNIPKLLVIAGAVAVACSLDPGLLPKSLLVEVAKRFASIGRGGPRL